MDYDRCAHEIISAIGGPSNISADDVSMNRLRIQTLDQSKIDTTKLSMIRGVLGFIKRTDGILEVVFGPGKAEMVHDAINTLSCAAIDTKIPDIRSYSQNSSIEIHIIPDSPPVTSPLSTQEQNKYPGPASESLNEIDNLAGMLITISEHTKDRPLEPVHMSLKPQQSPDTAQTKPGNSGARLLVLNGPNINMLGSRQPELYGYDTYQTLLDLCRQSATEAGFLECTCFQSNHEGDLIEAIQDAYEQYEGIVFNPGAYAHTSIALLDAAEAVNIPMVEVHISSTDQREGFRKISYIRNACIGEVEGLGIEGYKKAIGMLARYLGLKKSTD